MELHPNRLTSKEAYNVAIQTAIKNMQVEVKNLKAEFANLKKSGHPSGASAANKDNVRMTTRWKREGQAHHPTWWSTT